MITLFVIEIADFHSLSETIEYTIVNKSPLYFLIVQITKEFAGTSRLVKFSSKLSSSCGFEVVSLVTSY
jgi:hypothetical protein